MSTNRLDMVKTCDQFGHDHWKALATKLGGVEVVKTILRNQVLVRVEAKGHLTVLRPVMVPAGNFNPCEFFRTRTGMWLSNGFHNYILAVASKGEVSANGTTVGYIDLAKAVNDAEIGRALPVCYVFKDVDRLLVYIASLIKNQQGRQDEELLNDGCFNLFYINVNDETFEILVRYCSHDEVWQCLASRPSAKAYCSCLRVFSATAA